MFLTNTQVFKVFELFFKEILYFLRSLFNSREIITPSTLLPNLETAWIVLFFFPLCTPNLESRSAELRSAHQSQSWLGQARPPVVQMGQELSQCFLSDRRALRFHFWCKLSQSVLGCLINPPPANAIMPTHTASFPLCHKSMEAELEWVSGTQAEIYFIATGSLFHLGKKKKQKPI